MHFIVDLILFALVGYGTHFLGAIGFAQIIGSLQARQKNFLFPLILWSVILIAFFVAIYRYLPDYHIALYGGYLLSFLAILSAGKVE